MKQFFPYNKEVEDHLSEIKKSIRLSMNGVASEAMSHLRYKKNYGVSLVRIKEIAARYPHNPLLAQRLWALGYRETKIIATLLQPADKFTQEMAEAWISEFNNLELVEQSCRNLFVNLPFANELAFSMSSEEDRYKKATAYILYSLLIMKNRETEFHFLSFLEKAAVDVYNESAVVYTSVARFLKQAGTKYKEPVQDFLSRISVDVNGAAWVREEVKTFLYQEE